MHPQNEYEVLRCATSLRQRYGSGAVTNVQRQITWSTARNAQHEVLFWSAVLKRFDEADQAVSQIRVLQPGTDKANAYKLETTAISERRLNAGSA